MKAADLMVRSLENEGVKYIFGVPGEENLDLVESIRQSSISLILTRHEQEAGFMAATYGRLTSKTGVCLATLGPGATNLVTAAAYAQLGAMPILMITGQKPIKKSKQGKFQIIDVVEIMKPLTKFTKQIVHGNTIPSLIRECFRLSMHERPGAVHLEFPEDIAREDTDELIFPIVELGRPNADEKTIIQAVNLFKQAKKPIFLIGAAANRKKTAKALTNLIDKTGLAFFNTQMGKGVIDERNPLFMGTAALSEGDYVHSAIDNADLIINIGHDIVEKPPFFMHRNHSVKVIHVNFFPAQIDEVYFPNLEIIGDIANTVERLTSLLESMPHWQIKNFSRIKKCIDNNVKEKVTSENFPLLPQRLVADVRNCMPDDGILTLDNGLYKIWFARNYYAYKPNTILLDNALASMGAGLPSGMATAILYPKRAVVVVCGDGGFMMNAQALETAVRLNLNLVILVLNDHAFGMIKWKQEKMHFKDYGLDFTNPDFVLFAKAHGARGHRVELTKQFSPLLKEALSNTGVDLIDVPIDYSESVFDLGEGIQNDINNITT